MRDGRDETEADIQSQIQEINKLILDHSPLGIIAQMSFRNSNYDSENFKEYKSEINPAYTEYIALLCLTQHYESFRFQNPEPIHPGLIEELQQKVKKLFQAETRQLVFKDIDLDKPARTTLDRLRFFSLAESLLVRYSAYQHHLIQSLQGIFSPLEAEMNASVGFNISEVLTILKGVDEIRLLKLFQRWAEATEFEQKLRKAVRDYRNHKRRKEFPSEFPGELLDKLTKEKSKAAKRKIREMVTSWTSYALGDTTSFSVQELAGLTQLPLEKIATFLDRF